MRWLFDEVLALLSGQENSGAFSQSADECHLLAAVPQLQRLHPGHQKAWQQCGVSENEWGLSQANTATHLSERSPLLSLLVSDWLSVPADLLSTEARLLAAISWEELWEELLPLSVSSQPPPTCPGHRWVTAVVKTSGSPRSQNKHFYHIWIRLHTVSRAMIYELHQ